MNKALKIILIVGLILVLVGFCLFIVSLAVANWDPEALSDTVVETKTYTEPANAEITDVTLFFENADIEILFRESAEEMTVEYPQLLDRQGNPKNKITITETASGVEISEKMLWYKSIINLWSFTSSKVTVILPADRDYRLCIETENGAITVDGNAHNIQSIALSTDNGRITTESADLTCSGSFSCITANGKITLGRFHADTVLAETNNGMITAAQDGSATEDIRFLSDNGKLIATGNLNAHEFYAESDNGDLQFSGEINVDVFTATADNGNIFATGKVTAQSITLETDNGDINANVVGKREDYTITVEKDLGTSNIHSQPGGDKELQAETNIGDIDITFAAE